MIQNNNNKISFLWKSGPNIKHGNQSPDLAPRIHQQIPKRIKLLDMAMPNNQQKKESSV